MGTTRELRAYRARRVNFAPLDDRRVKEVVILGRAEVELDGQRVDAFHVASTNPRDLGKRFAMFFEWREKGWPEGRVCRMVLAELDEAPT